MAGIRPQHVTVGHGELTATIEVNEMLGSEVNLHAQSEQDEVVMVIPTANLKVDVSAGSKVNFTAHPKLIQLLTKNRATTSSGTIKRAPMPAPPCANSIHSKLISIQRRHFPAPVFLAFGWTKTKVSWSPQ